MSGAVRGLKAGAAIGKDLAGLYFDARKMKDEREEKEERDAFFKQLGEVGAKRSVPSDQPQADAPVGLGAPAAGPAAQPQTRSDRSGGYTSVAGSMAGGGASEPRANRAAPGAENPYMAMADAEAKRAGIDPEIYRKLIHQESRWNPKAKSPVGAFGLTQIMPATGRQPGYGVQPLRDQSPQEQLRFGADYFKALLNEFGGDYKLAAAAYNAGPKRVQDAGGVPNIKETRDYVATVIGDYRGGDPRTASTAGGGPAVSPHTLPDRAGGLGQPPQSQQQGARQRVDSTQADQAAQAYQETLQLALSNPKYMDKAAPVLQALQQDGMSKWMQSFEGDPLSLDAWRHYGRGAAQFGIVVSPDKGISLQFQANQDARADRGEDRADRSEDRQDRQFRHNVLQDERTQERADGQFGLSENTDDRQERQLGLAEETSRRQDEKHNTDQSAAERKAQQERMVMHRQIVTAMDKVLEDGVITPAEQQFLERTFKLKVTGNKRYDEVPNPITGEMQKVTEYEIEMPDGTKEWASKEAVAGEAAAFTEIAELDKEDQSQVMTVKNSGIDGGESLVQVNKTKGTAQVVPVAGLGGSPAAPQSRSEERKPSPASTIEKPLKAALINGEEVIMVGSKSFAPVFGKPYSLPNGETRYYAGPGKWSLKKPEQQP